MVWPVAASMYEVISQRNLTYAKVLNLFGALDRSCPMKLSSDGNVSRQLQVWGHPICQVSFWEWVYRSPQATGCSQVSGPREAGACPCVGRTVSLEVRQGSHPLLLRMGQKSLLIGYCIVGMWPIWWSSPNCYCPLPPKSCLWWEHSRRHCDMSLGSCSHMSVIQKSFRNICWASCMSRQCVRLCGSRATDGAMVHFMWAKDAQVTSKTLSLDMSRSAFLGEISIWSIRLRKEDHPPQCGLASSNALMAWVEQKGGKRANSLLLRQLECLALLLLLLFYCYNIKILCSVMHLFVMSYFYVAHLKRGRTYHPKICHFGIWIMLSIYILILSSERIDLFIIV